MARKILNIVFVLALVAIFFTFPSDSKALTVSPAKIEYSVNPGDTVGNKIFLFNETETDLELYPVFQKFIEEEGTKTFLKDQSDLAGWIKAESPVFLKSGEKKYIPYTIEIPKNAPPGGHFAVMWWSTAPPGGTGVSIVTKVGILTMIRVSGDIKEDARIMEFSPVNSKKFVWSLPVKFSLVFKNDGNVHLKPTGNILIKNIFGRTKAVIKVNESLLQILSYSKRTFDQEWKAGRFDFGFFKAEVNLLYGEAEKTVSSKTWFIFIPLKILTIIIVVLIIIFIGFPFAIKKYNRWIINKAKGNG